MMAAGVGHLIGFRLGAIDMVVARLVAAVPAAIFIAWTM